MAFAVDSLHLNNLDCCSVDACRQPQRYEGQKQLLFSRAPGSPALTDRPAHVPTRKQGITVSVVLWSRMPFHQGPLRCRGLTSIDKEIGAQAAQVRELVRRRAEHGYGLHIQIRSRERLQQGQAR